MGKLEQQLANHQDRFHTLCWDRTVPTEDIWTILVSLYDNIGHNFIHNTSTRETSYLKYVSVDDIRDTNHLEG